MPFLNKIDVNIFIKTIDYKAANPISIGGFISYHN